MQILIFQPYSRKFKDKVSAERQSKKKHWPEKILN